MQQHPVGVIASTMMIKNLNTGDKWYRLIMNSLAILVTRQPRGHNFAYHQLSRICAEMTVAALAAEIGNMTRSPITPNKNCRTF